MGGGKAADVVAMKGKTKIAIEVQTTDAHEKENLKKCQEEGFDRIVIVHTRDNKRQK